MIALDARDLLGEGPVWDGDELVRVDITGRRVHAWDPASGATRVIAETDGDVSAAIPCTDGTYVLAVERELRHDDRVLARVGPDSDDVRLNDCRVGPDGAIWAGTMSRTRVPEAGALHRVTPDGELTTLLAATVSNGLAWHGERFYYVDSPTQRIDVFDYAGGAIANRRPFATIDPSVGLPDGIALDAEGGLWVCFFGGGALRRYAPDGTLDAHVDLPVTNPTCPAFGGPDLRTLFVTSARHRLSDEQLAAEPHAGCVLALDPGVAGLPPHRFTP